MHAFLWNNTPYKVKGFEKSRAQQFYQSRAFTYHDQYVIPPKVAICINIKQNSDIKMIKMLDGKMA